MKKNFFSCILVFLMALQLCMFPVAAEETQSADTTQPSSTATEPTMESTQPSTESTQPTTENTQPSTESTTAPTVPAESCSHTYGTWSATEGAHSRSCTKCNHTESSGHTWYAETVTVAPTCKDGGGSAKFCTICEFILITEIVPPLTTHTYTNNCDADCNVCGAKRQITHNYSAAWSNNAKGHWHACTVCGAAEEVKAHYPGPAATEEKEQLCLTCGYVMMQKKNHTHKASATFSTNDFGHWYACTGCSEQMNYADHMYADDCDANCNICGYTRSNCHTYGTDWQRDEKSHSNVCLVCGQASPMDLHIFDGSGKNCSICGYEMEATEEIHTHSFDEGEWEFDDAGHWKLCRCGERQVPAEHQWDDGIEEDNLVRFSCKVCDAEKQEIMVEHGFPWLSVLLGIVALAATAGIVVCICLLRKQGKYSR